MRYPPDQKATAREALLRARRVLQLLAQKRCGRGRSRCVSLRETCSPGSTSSPRPNRAATSGLPWLIPLGR